MVRAVWRGQRGITYGGTCGRAGSEEKVQGAADEQDEGDERERGHASACKWYWLYLSYRMKSCE